MKNLTHAVTIQSPIGNLYRKNHALILIEMTNGKYLLGKKEGYYPDHISRMIGGGIDEGEDPELAAAREVEEELGISVSQDRIIKLAKVVTDAETSEGFMSMTTHIFLLRTLLSEEMDVLPGDDITGVEPLTKNQFVNLIRDMYALQGVFHGTYDGKPFQLLWEDWGAIYAPIHENALACAGEYEQG